MFHVSLHSRVGLSLFLGSLTKVGAMQDIAQIERKTSNTPMKVIKPDDLCRVCRCGPAVFGQGKYNLFSTQFKEQKLADQLQTMLGQPVHKVSGMSSTICYKWKRELEKFEKYIQVLEVELKQFRELYVGFPLSRFCLCTLTYVKIENVGKSTILRE